MTNEQLGILLVNIVSQLETALNTASKALSNTDIPYNKKEEYIGENAFHFAQAVKNPEEYQLTKTLPIAFNEIVQVVKNINEQIELLLKDKNV